jgi:hypothetical protein
VVQAFERLKIKHALTKIRPGDSVLKKRLRRITDDFSVFPYPEKKDGVGLFYYCFVEFDLVE